MPKTREGCPATMESKDDPGHTHQCSGSHNDTDHYCKDCGRWFYQKPKS